MQQDRSCSLQNSQEMLQKMSQSCRAVAVWAQMMLLLTLFLALIPGVESTVAFSSTWHHPWNTGYIPATPAVQPVPVMNQGRRSFSNSRDSGAWRAWALELTTLCGELPAGRGGPDGTKEQVGSSPEVQRLPGGEVRIRMRETANSGKGATVCPENLKKWQRAQVRMDLPKKMERAAASLCKPYRKS